MACLVLPGQPQELPYLLNDLATLDLTSETCMLVKRNALDTEAMLKRCKRLEKTPEEVAAENAGSKARKLKMKEMNTEGGLQ